jgi:hypothetical protein
VSITILKLFSRISRFVPFYILSGFNIREVMTPEIKEYLRMIGSRGGKANKGTEAAKVRSKKALAARLAKKQNKKENSLV